MAMALGKFPVQKLARYPRFIHADDVSCPAHAAGGFRTIASMLVVLALSRTSRLDTFSCQRIFRMERRLRRWNASGCWRGVCIVTITCIRRGGRRVSLVCMVQ